MFDLIYTVKNGRIYRPGAIQHEPEIEVLLQYYDGQQAKLNLIQVPGAIQYGGKFFTLRLRGRKDPVIYDELIVTNAANIDTDLIRKLLKQDKTLEQLTIPSTGNGKS